MPTQVIQMSQYHIFEYLNVVKDMSVIVKEQPFTAVNIHSTLQTEAC